MPQNIKESTGWTKENFHDAWRKNEQVPILPPKDTSTLLDAKTVKKKYFSSDLYDNPNYPFWEAHGQAG